MNERLAESSALLTSNDRFTRIIENYNYKM